MRVVAPPLGGRRGTGYEGLGAAPAGAALVGARPRPVHAPAAWSRPEISSKRFTASPTSSAR